MERRLQTSAVGAGAALEAPPCRDQRRGRRRKVSRPFVHTPSRARGSTESLPETNRQATGRRTSQRLYDGGRNDVVWCCVKRIGGSGLVKQPSRGSRAQGPGRRGKGATRPTHAKRPLHVKSEPGRNSRTADRPFVLFYGSFQETRRFEKRAVRGPQVWRLAKTRPSTRPSDRGTTGCRRRQNESPPSEGRRARAGGALGGRGHALRRTGRERPGLGSGPDGSAASVVKTYAR